MLKTKSRDSPIVYDSSKVNENCQKVNTDCKDVNTDYKAKKEGIALPPVILSAGVAQW